MITELQITNFKCFGKAKPFEFSKLNLLTGINGRGKSSLLQALLILSQSARENLLLEKLFIKGELINLGNFNDIKNSETPRGENIQFNFTFSEIIDEIKIKLENSDEQFNISEIIDEIKIEYTENPDDSLYANLVKAQYNIEVLSKKLKPIHFVSADRLGPVNYVEKTTLPAFINVGPRGEHTINILANSINLDNVNDVLYRGNDAKSVIQQTIEWLGYILEGAKVEIKGKDKDSSVLYMLLNNKNNAYGYKPANVGFGYSYILPLIVTGLIAKKGEIIIIENPEAHLHPRAQSRIAEFFAKVATCGVQVFIESHSEHILNGLRVNALNPEIPINHNELIIHYFNESFEAEKLIMDNKGKITNWPDGFFDQQEIDLSEIFKYSR